MVVSLYTVQFCGRHGPGSDLLLAARSGSDPTEISRKHWLCLPSGNRTDLGSPSLCHNVDRATRATLAAVFQGQRGTSVCNGCVMGGGWELAGDGIFVLQTSHKPPIIFAC